MSYHVGDGGGGGGGGGGGKDITPPVTPLSAPGVTPPGAQPPPLPPPQPTGPSLSLDPISLQTQSPSPSVILDSLATQPLPLPLIPPGDPVGAAAASATAPASASMSTAPSLSSVRRQPAPAPAPAPAQAPVPAPLPKPKIPAKPSAAQPAPAAPPPEIPPTAAASASTATARGKRAKGAAADSGAPRATASRPAPAAPVVTEAVTDLRNIQLYTPFTWDAEKKVASDLRVLVQKTASGATGSIGDGVLKKTVALAPTPADVSEALDGFGRGFKKAEEKKTTVAASNPAEELARMAKEIETLKNSGSISDAKIRDLEAKLGEAKRTHERDEKEKKQLTESLSKTKESKDRKEAAIVTLTGEKTELTARVRDLTASLKAEEKKVSDAEASANAVNTQLEECKRKSAQLEAAIEEKTRAIAEHAAQIASREERIRQTTTESVKLESVNTDLRARLQELGEQLASVTAEHNALKKAVDENKVAGNKDLIDASAAADLAGSEATAIRARIEELKRQTEGNRKRVAELKTEEEKARKEHADLLSQREAHATGVGEIRASLVAIQQEIGVYTATLHATTKQRERLSKSLAEIKDAAAATMAESNATVEQQITELRNAITELAVQNARAGASIVAEAKRAAGAASAGSHKRRSHRETRDSESDGEGEDKDDRRAEDEHRDDDDLFAESANPDPNPVHPPEEEEPKPHPSRSHGLDPVEEEQKFHVSHTAFKRKESKEAFEHLPSNFAALPAYPEWEDACLALRPTAFCLPYGLGGPVYGSWFPCSRGELGKKATYVVKRVDATTWVMGDFDSRGNITEHKLEPSHFPCFGVAAKAALGTDAEYFQKHPGLDEKSLKPHYKGSPLKIENHNPIVFENNSITALVSFHVPANSCFDTKDNKYLSSKSSVWGFLFGTRKKDEDKEEKEKNKKKQKTDSGISGHVCFVVRGSTLHEATYPDTAVWKSIVSRLPDKLDDDDLDPSIVQAAKRWYVTYAKHVLHVDPKEQDPDGYNRILHELNIRDPALPAAAATKASREKQATGKVIRDYSTGPGPRDPESKEPVKEGVHQEPESTKAQTDAQWYKALAEINELYGNAHSSMSSLRENVNGFLATVGSLIRTEGSAFTIVDDIFLIVSERGVVGIEHWKDVPGIIGGPAALMEHHERVGRAQRKLFKDRTEIFGRWSGPFKINGLALDKYEVYVIAVGGDMTEFKRALVAPSAPLHPPPHRPPPVHTSPSRGVPSRKPLPELKSTDGKRDITTELKDYLDSFTELTSRSTLTLGNIANEIAEASTVADSYIRLFRNSRQRDGLVVVLYEGQNVPINTLNFTEHGLYEWIKNLPFSEMIISPLLGGGLALVNGSISGPFNINIGKDPVRAHFVVVVGSAVTPPERKTPDPESTEAKSNIDSEVESYIKSFTARRSTHWPLCKIVNEIAADAKTGGKWQTLFGNSRKHTGLAVAINESKGNIIIVQYTNDQLNATGEVVRSQLRNASGQLVAGARCGPLPLDVDEKQYVSYWVVLTSSGQPPAAGRVRVGTKLNFGSLGQDEKWLFRCLLADPAGAGKFDNRDLGQCILVMNAVANMAYDSTGDDAADQDAYSKFLRVTFQLQCTIENNSDAKSIIASFADKFAELLVDKKELLRDMFVTTTKVDNLKKFKVYKETSNALHSVKQLLSTSPKKPAVSSLASALNFDPVISMKVMDLANERPAGIQLREYLCYHAAEEYSRVNTMAYYVLVGLAQMEWTDNGSRPGTKNLGTVNAALRAVFDRLSLTHLHGCKDSDNFWTEPPSARPGAVADTEAKTAGRVRVGGDARFSAVYELDTKVNTDVYVYSVLNPRISPVPRLVQVEATSEREWTALGNAQNRLVALLIALCIPSERITPEQFSFVWFWIKYQPTPPVRGAYGDRSEPHYQTMMRVIASPQFQAVVMSLASLSSKTGVGELFSPFMHDVIYDMQLLSMAGLHLQNDTKLALPPSRTVFCHSVILTFVKKYQLLGGVYVDALGAAYTAARRFALWNTSGNLQGAINCVKSDEAKEPLMRNATVVTLASWMCFNGGKIAHDQPTAHSHFTVSEAAHFMDRVHTEAAYIKASPESMFNDPIAHAQAMSFILLGAAKWKKPELSW